MTVIPLSIFIPNCNAKLFASLYQLNNNRTEAPVVGNIYFSLFKKHSSSNIYFFFMMASSIHQLSKWHRSTSIHNQKSQLVSLKTDEHQNAMHSIVASLSAFLINDHHPSEHSASLYQWTITELNLLLSAIYCFII